MSVRGMKSFSRSRLVAGLLFLVFLVVTSRAGDLEERQTHDQQIEAAYETVFFSVLDGCFQDGLSNADVDQILRRTAPNQSYEHFIYACPICMATARALEAYRAGPDFTERKVGGKVCFGQGLTPEMHARLYSQDPKDRLSIIHDLEQNWVSRRLASLRLDVEERAQAQKAQLKLKRVGRRDAASCRNFIQAGATRTDRPRPTAPGTNARCATRRRGCRSSCAAARLSAPPAGRRTRPPTPAPRPPPATARRARAAARRRRWRPSPVARAGSPTRPPRQLGQREGDQALAAHVRYQRQPDQHQPAVRCAAKAARGTQARRGNSAAPVTSPLRAMIAPSRKRPRRFLIERDSPRKTPP